MTKSTLFQEIDQFLREASEGPKYAEVATEHLKAFYTDMPSSESKTPATHPKNIASPMPAMERRQTNPTPQVNTPPSNTQPMERQQTNPIHHAPAPPSAQPIISQPAGNPAIMTFPELKACVSKCANCALSQGRNKVVFGEGNENADLLFIGEGPGYDEDIQGRPFVGKAGHLLDKMINAMGFNRNDVYIANIVKCRPPKNRNPEDHEAVACLPYLQRQIDLIRPKVIITLGSVPFKQLLNLNGIMRNRGQWRDYHGIPVMPTFHPAYLLRYNEAKRPVWEDLQQVMKFLGRNP